MVTTSLMTEVEFQAYRAKSIPDYAAEHACAGNWHPSEALERAQKEFDHLLPDGVNTKNHFLYSLVNEDGEKVGLLWYQLDDMRPTKTAFIYDFVVFEPFRRRGYGSAALAALEERLRSLEVQKIELHVFGHNTVAQALYRKAGYEVTGLYMTRILVRHS